MRMPNFAKTWSREQVLALPDDGHRYELVDGLLLVSPAPRRCHQTAVRNLFRLIDPYVARHGLGETMFAPADLDLRADQLVQPDLFVVPPLDPHHRLHGEEYGIPILIAEVLSPTTIRADRIVKRRRYQRSGVGCYWIIDLENRLVEEWTPNAVGPALFEMTLRWEPAGATEPLLIDLPALFEGIWQSATGRP